MTFIDLERVAYEISFGDQAKFIGGMEPVQMQIVA